jgi:signal transduction histidine kinase/CheY-like chemotaxis protein
LGTHPTTEVNDKYLEFVSTAASLLGTWLGSSNLIQTLRTREEQFKEDKSKLAITCDELRKQLDNQEKLLGHFANGTSVGIFMANPHGQCAYRNSGFNNIFRFPDGDDVTMHLVGEHCIDPEYLEKWLLAWKAVEAGKATTVELRLKRTWKPPHDGRGEEEEQQAWVMLSGFPEMGVDGDVGQLMGSVTDVSELKWRVECQERLTTEALESKRRLENFIDTTNHELRNPLSAISHAGEDIIRTSSAVLPGSGIDDTLQPEVRALLADVADSAKTVMLGARHQKRIIDDVLTASRLDSNLLSICPEIADPENELRSCVEMCKFESLDDCVDVRVVVCDSYRRHATTALKFDATRFNQVCVNLMMNAIRSSAFEPVRQVTIALEASPTEPLDNPTFGVQYFARSGSVGAGGSVDDAQQLAHEEEQWGAGASVYLVVTVVDTGRGISDEQVKVLFTHFGQVSPRTHVRYGGNGLGLFISRRLTEMQGGRIGFKTAVGKGSTFSFYVRARRATDVLALEHAGGELRLGGAVAAPAENVAGARAPNGDCAAAAAATTTTNGGPVGGSWCAELSPPAEGVRRALALAKLLEGQDPARPSPIAVSVAPRMPRRPQSLSIMVVEDNAVNQKVLVKGLRKMGCKVLVANNGAEALAMLAETRWCRGGKGGGAELTCMLLDWEMPVMDGLTCVAKIREMERRGEMGHLPVMGLTANARPAQLKQATEAGMVGGPWLVFRLALTDDRTTQLRNRYRLPF